MGRLSGAYLSQVYNFLSLQHRSPYVNRMKDAGEGALRTESTLDVSSPRS